MEELGDLEAKELFEVQAVLKCLHAMPSEDWVVIREHADQFESLKARLLIHRPVSRPMSSTP